MTSMKYSIDDICLECSCTHYALYSYTLDVFLPSPISLLCNLRESKEVCLHEHVVA